MNKNTYNSKLKKYQFISFVLLLVIQIVLLVTPYLYQNILNAQSLDESNEKLIVMIIILIGVPLIVVLFQAGYNYIVITFSRKFGNEISIDLFKHIVNQPLEFFNKNNSVELTSYISKESVNYVVFNVMDIPKFWVYFITMIVIGVITFTYSPLIVLLQISFIPLLILPTRLFKKLVQKEISSVIELNGQVMQLRADVIKGIEYVKTMDLIETKVTQISEANTKINRVWGKISVFDMLSGLWGGGFLTSLFTGLSFGLLVLILKNDTNSNINNFGIFMMIYSFCVILFNNINDMYKSYYHKSKVDQEFHKLFSYFNLDCEKDGNKHIENEIEKIEFKNLSFSYQSDNKIISDFNFEMINNKWYGINGESGIGKTTLLNIILKLHEVADQMVLINNTDINNLYTKDIRGKITKISQDVFLFPGSIIDNFRLVNHNISYQEATDLLELACLDSYYKRLPDGLNTEVGEAGKLLSGGEKQRLALALGLARKTNWYLFDEITANLDSALSLKLLKNLSNYRKKENLTYIMVSHGGEFLDYVDQLYTFKR